MQNNEGHKSLHIAAYKNKLYTDMNAYEETEESYLIQEIDKITGKQKSQWLDADSTNCGITGGFASGLGPFYQRVDWVYFCVSWCYLLSKSVWEELY